MLTVIQAVRQILFSSDIPLESFRMGILNLSAYAALIHEEVEQKTKKNVQTNTITVALSRLQKELTKVPALRSEFQLQQLSIQPDLIDITYEKTIANMKGIRKLAEITQNISFLTFSEGVNEITIITPRQHISVVMSCFSDQPKAAYEHLVGISVKFGEEYLPQANLIYSILGALASHRINLMEIVSTYTELTMVIEEKDMRVAVEALEKYL